MQVNARMGGGPVYAMNQYVWGVDLVEEQFLGACGIPSRPYLSRVPQKCIAEFSVNAQKSGTLQNTDWVDVSPLPSVTCQLISVGSLLARLLHWVCLFL